MAEYIVKDTTLKAMADVIREATGTNGPIEFRSDVGFATDISDISSGGSGVGIGISATSKFKMSQPFKNVLNTIGISMTVDHTFSTEIVE